jgi:hypothetical protein
VSLNLDQGDYVIKFVNDLQQVCGFLHQLNWMPWYNWNIVESGVKHHQTNEQTKIFVTMSQWWIYFNFNTNKISATNLDKKWEK